MNIYAYVKISIAMGQSWTNQVRRIGVLCAINLSLYLNCFAGVDQGEKKVTLNVVEESCVRVFKQIEKQTKMSFFYSTSDIKLPGKVSIKVVDAALDEVMGRILEGTNLEWIYTDNVITIRKKKGLAGGGNGTGTVADSNINMITVTGKVTQADGTGIPGATVRVKRTGDGVTTDGDGEFVLPNTRRNDLLLISSIGYGSREIPVSGNSIMVKLNIVVSDLDVTVVKGYYFTTRRLNTGAVSKVTSEVISRQPIADPILSLQGFVPGLQISQKSGIPGSDITVRLRGQNSIANGNEPLYIIDGIPYPSKSITNSFAGGGAAALSPFANISITSIESVEVLKDADATAIYGSRGANGVILITTKKGMQGKTKVSVNVNSGIGNIGKNIQLLHTTEYLKLRRLAFENDGQVPQDFDYDVNGIWDTTKYTNWPKTLIGKTSKINNVELNISGGSEQTQFTVGGTFRNETTVFPGNFRDRKISSFFNISNVSNNKKFKVSLSASYLNDNNLIPLIDVTSYIFSAPNAPALYTSDGKLNWQNNSWDNPLGILQRKSSSIAKNLLSNATASYNILPGLEVKATFGYNNIDMDESLITPLTSYRPSFSSYTYLRKNTQAFNNISTWNAEPQITYSRHLSKGELNVLLGTTFQETINKSTVISASDFPTDEMLENITAAASLTSTNTYAQYRYNALFGRINYNWDNKYLLNLTGRRDGSSRFGPGKRYGNFGAVGIGWIFSNEHFLKKTISWLSFGKIRASYGTTGNDQLVDYQYLSTYASSYYTYLGLTGLYPSRLANLNYNWEQLKKLEFGLDMGLLEDRLVLSADYYKNRTSNQLVGYALPTITGFETVQANLPAVIQNSGVELELSTFNFRQKELTWKTIISLTIPRNKLVSYPNLEGSSYVNRYEVGKSLFISKGFHYTGLDKGQFTFEDVNGDGRTSFYEDYAAYKEIAPNYYGGIQNSLSFRNFQVDIFIQFVKQTGINYLYYGYMPGQFNKNQPRDILAYFSNGNLAGPSQDYGSDRTLGYSNFAYSDGRIGNASFIRLKNVSISYNLPSRTIKTLKLTNFAIYLQGQNIFTISKYKGLDPEIRSESALPPLRIITAGLRLSF